MAEQTRCPVGSAFPDMYILVRRCGSTCRWVGISPDYQVVQNALFSRMMLESIDDYYIVRCKFDILDHFCMNPPAFNERADVHIAGLFGLEEL